ncbi:hypothetical protein LguiA_008067 [Lonicera macranthoides]
MLLLSSPFASELGMDPHRRRPVKLHARNSSFVRGSSQVHQGTKWKMRNPWI